MRLTSLVLLALLSAPLVSALPLVPYAWTAEGPAGWHVSTTDAGATPESIDAEPCQGTLSARSYGPMPAGEHKGEFHVTIDVEPSRAGCEPITREGWIPAGPRVDSQHTLRDLGAVGTTLAFETAADGTRTLILAEWDETGERPFWLDLAAHLSETDALATAG